jgi:hypothetical protein
MSTTSINIVIGGVAAVAIGSGANIGINEMHQQAQADFARSYIIEYANTANAMFIEDGAWPSDLSTIKTHMAAVPAPRDFAEPILTVREDGALIFTINASDTKEATRLVKSNLDTNFAVNGTKVTYTVTPPQGSALRNVYKTEIDSTNKLAFSPNKSIDLNSHQITALDEVSVSSLVTNCVLLGSSSVCDGGSGNLQITTSLAQISQNLQASTTINASIVELINSLKAKTLTAIDLTSENTTAGDMIISAANLTNADINLLTSISANMKSILSEKLTVSGNTKLANLIGNNASFTNLTGTDFNVSAKAVMKALEVNGLSGGYAQAEIANIAQLIATTGEIDNLTANLIEVNKLIAAKGVIDDIRATTASSQSVVLTKGTISTLNTTTFKGKLVDLGAAVIKANLTVDSGTIGTVTSDSATLTQLNSSKLNSVAINGKSLNVSNLLTVKDIVVTDAATITGNAVVSGLTKTKALNATGSTSIGNILTALRLVVNNDLIVMNVLKSKDLNVTNNATLNEVAVTTNLGTQNATANTKSTASTMTVTGNATVGGVASITQNASANSMTVTGKATAGQLVAGTGSIQDLNSSNLSASNKLQAVNLLTQFQATINNAVTTNLSATNSSLGAISGVSLVLSNKVQANTAALNSINVIGLATLGTLESTGSTLIRGALNVTTDITGQKNLSAGNVTAPTANIGIVNANTVTAAGNITTGNALTSSGGNLNTANSIYINHDSRILTVEQFKAECASNWTYACSGTLPKLQDISCTGCTQTSNASGSFSATSLSKIIDCPAGCNYSWTVGAGLYKTSCLNGSVSAGQVKSVNCLVNASPTVGVDQTLNSNVKLSVTHSQRAALAVQNDYAVTWSFVGATPSGSIICTNCNKEQSGSGVFNASILANIGNCEAGCSYVWTFGSGVAADVCANGSFSSASQAISCKVKSSPEVPAGQKLESNVKVKVTSNSSASKFYEDSYPISWENVVSYNLNDESKVSCNGSCINCNSAPINCTANMMGRRSPRITATASISAIVEGACRPGDDCVYTFTPRIEFQTGPTPQWIVSGNTIRVSITNTCSSGNWIESELQLSIHVNNKTLNQTFSLSNYLTLVVGCSDTQNDL